jgi:inosose dehydratase
LGGRLCPQPIPLEPVGSIAQLFSAAQTLDQQAPSMNRVNRRQFLVTSATVVAVGALSHPQTARAEDTDLTAPYGGFRVGLQSNVLSGFSAQLEPMLENIAGLGLRWVEFAHWHYEVTEDQTRIAQVQALLDRHNLRMEAYFLGEIEADAQRLRQTFQFARRNGVTVLVGQPTHEAFPVLDGLVKEFDLKVAVHNYGPGHRFDRIDDIIRIVTPWDERIGYCLDTGHAMRSGEDPVRAVRAMGSRLHGMHLREQAAIRRDPQPPETIVGEGALELDALCRALRAARFSGPLSIEVYYNQQQPLEPLRKSLANLAQAARRTL